MAQPVWVLSVDLQAKTATFQTGLAEAAKTARGAFNDIKSGASEMGGHVSTNMFASRHAIMAVSEAFGDTMPRAITALLVHLGPVGAALEAAFPYAAIGLAAVLLVQHFAKMREESQKLVMDQERLGTTVNNVFENLDEKMLQAGIRSDELRNDHLGALRLQLELIDKQSLGELVRQFGILEKAADLTFNDLKSHWYTFGIGSAGAKNALDEFQVKYESLLAKGKDKEASDLLRGTRESAEKVLAAQQALSQSHPSKSGSDVDMGEIEKNIQRQNILKAAGVGYSTDEVKAQQTLLEVLSGQEGVEKRVSELRKVDSSNASAATGNQMAALRAAAQKESASLFGEDGRDPSRSGARASNDYPRNPQRQYPRASRQRPPTRNPRIRDPDAGKPAANRGAQQNGG